jgi:hypothetical protein
MPFAFIDVPCSIEHAIIRRLRVGRPVLSDHGAQPFGWLGEVNVTDVNRRDEEHV